MCVYAQILGSRVLGCLAPDKIIYGQPCILLVCEFFNCQPVHICQVSFELYTVCIGIVMVLNNGCLLKDIATVAKLLEMIAKNMINSTF